MISILDIFRIGIGPSSSHTVGPMRIANRFIDQLDQKECLGLVGRITVTFRGSLAFTGRGHASDVASILGLQGFSPKELGGVDFKAQIARVRSSGTLMLNGTHSINFDIPSDLIFDYDTPTDLHPNEMVLEAFDANGSLIVEETYYSTGGGFIASYYQLSKPAKNDLVSVGGPAPFPFTSAAELLAICRENQISIYDLVLANEDTRRPREETILRLDEIAKVMSSCIDRGLKTRGTLPGGLDVQRRAPDLWRKLKRSRVNETETLFDHLNVYAMAVNEENASGGRIVTAPTNGAAGILPAIIRHYCSAGDKSDTRHLLIVAGAIGQLYKQRASISGAEMGCQGEIGVACSMAAAGLAAIWGGAPYCKFCPLQKLAWSTILG